MSNGWSSYSWQRQWRKEVVNFHYRLSKEGKDRHEKAQGKEVRGAMREGVEWNDFIAGKLVVGEDWWSRLSHWGIRHWSCRCQNKFEEGDCKVKPNQVEQSTDHNWLILCRAIVIKVTNECEMKEILLTRNEITIVNEARSPMNYSSTHDARNRGLIFAIIERVYSHMTCIKIAWGWKEKRTPVVKGTWPKDGRRKWFWKEPDGDQLSPWIFLATEPLSWVPFTPRA